MSTYSLSTALSALALLLVSSISSAAPVNLGAAGDYTLLSVGTPWTSPGGGSLVLGVEANIEGNVGARDYLGFANGVVISGNTTTSGTTSASPDVSIGGIEQTVNSGLWTDYYQDLSNASQYAASLAGQNLSAITGNTTLSSSGSMNVFHLDGDLTLGKGESLVLSGNATDQFIINIGKNLTLGPGAAILFEGISAANVIFNFIGDSFAHSAVIDGNGSTTQIGGIFLGPNTYFTLGDGLITPDGLQVLGSGIIGNLQTVTGFKDSVLSEVSEPGTLFLLSLGLLGLILIRRSN